MSNQPIPRTWPAEPVNGLRTGPAAPPVSGERAAAADDLPRLVASHAGLMYRVAYALLRHPQDAEDAVQDALLKLHRGGGLAGRREDVRDEKAYLARVVWRTAYDRLQARVVPVDDETAPLRLRDTRPTPEQSAADGDQHALLHELIDALPEDLRQPLLLSAIEELNSREIAEAIGIPEGTVRTRLQRARLRLRDLYQNRQDAAKSTAAQPNATSTTTSRPGETAVAGR